jgi:Putative MetA-pathway of phenol degradation
MKPETARPVPRAEGPRRRRSPARLLAGLALTFLGASSPVTACDSTSCSLLTRGENVLVPKRKFRLDLSFGYTDESVLLRGSQEVATVLRLLLEAKRILPDFHSDIDGFDRSVQMDVTYGLGSRVNLSASVPLALWRTHEVAHGGFQGEYGTEGIGDTLFGLRWSMRPRRLVAGLALKVPTGDHKVGGEFGGGIQDPALQPGTGAFDVVGSLQYGWRSEALGLNASVAGSYQLTTTNDLEYRFGNQAIVTAGVARPLVSRFSASLQAKVYHQARNRYLGQGVPSTGGTFVYINPGVRFTAPRSLSLYAFVLLVPYRHVNEAQLGPRVGILTGLSKLF